MVALSLFGIELVWFDLFLEKTGLENSKSKEPFKNEMIRGKLEVK